MPRRSYQNSSSKKSGGHKAAGGKPAGKNTKRSAKKKKSSARSESAGSEKSSDKTGVQQPAAAKRPARKSSTRARATATADSTRTTRDRPQRLQRLLAAAGFGSRRQCESMIEEGRVEVDGKVISELGVTVDPKASKVRVDGVPLRPQKLVYYAVNKPTGYLSTNADPRGRQRVIDLVPNSERVFPVGRLDQSSQGLMLLTNDGDLAQQLSHPRFGVRKVYRVTVAGKIDGETMRTMRKGIYISDGFVRVEGAKILKTRGRATDLEITLREGKNREIRRILASMGHKVQVLRRIAIGPLRLGDVPIGAYRQLTREEVQRLKLAIEHSRDEVQAEGEERKARSKATKGTKRRTSAKRSSGKHSRPETRSAVTSRRTSRKPTTTRVTHKPKSSDGGSVIGGD
ncbi:rRNA pseudouridine synthase [Stieleria sp. TO1_6]|uniref:pseudouridine synthase n=1 Tax=Stieleria tagensis TaxID=2956795 RepID=UPI00209A73D4|nr:pseudouridine synthase [Stieleria tagensis]MCO8122787.1 rRNA pseudouridine synthase [Stieleria tagensis]